MRILLIIAAFITSLSNASAQCVGENLIDAMDDTQRRALQTAVSQHPFSKGNFWKATKGDSTIHLLGTIHLDDPRLDDLMPRLWPAIDNADLILFEGDKSAMQKLQAEMASNLSLMFITDGPTLPERLSEQEWQQLSAEMSKRGIPSFLVSKMKPWYVSMMLALPAPWPR